MKILLAIIAALLALMSASILLVVGQEAAVASDFEYQCDVAIPTPSPKGNGIETRSRTAPAVPPPTANPYSQLTFAPRDTSVSDRQRACATAMQTAAYQIGPPLTEPATGTAGRCAGEILTALVNQSSGRTIDETTTTTRLVSTEPAAVTAGVIYRASIAAQTGVCGTPVIPMPEALHGMHFTSNSGRCPLANSRTITELPDKILAQSLCGQLVAAGAESPGDLVFWDYQKNAPTRMGMVIVAAHSDSKPVIVASWDPNSGRFVQLALPSRWDVRVKRVLSSAP
ncbi:hypothetical protein [Nocardia jejuensis]|uniref:hypothetical protein n=1 Tax=Nocardia jejuensis TaxID=328049 RepID=UPI000A6E5EA7|nr:hypothetical protein [Nocardia jejuensis]